MLIKQCFHVLAFGIDSRTTIEHDHSIPLRSVESPKVQDLRYSHGQAIFAHFLSNEQEPGILLGLHTFCITQKMLNVRVINC